VTIDLNLGQAQATAYYGEYLKLVGLDEITKVYLERLHNKPFWIWNIEEHKQEEIAALITLLHYLREME
ncbi:MAG: hypothetical protein ACJ704_04225, partial [Nitrososphaeraceae archaeon]